MAKTKPISIRGIDPRLWAEFRKMCIDEGKTVSKKLMEILEGLIDKKTTL